MSRSAFVTGIRGQDGSYLAELLLEKGYDVAGAVRAGSDDSSAQRVDGVELVEVDLLDPEALARVLRALRPREVYNLASPSFVPATWAEPVETGRAAGAAVASLLEAVRTAAPEARFVQASSAAIFGEPLEAPQTESTRVEPTSVYGAAKAYGHHLVRVYRLHHRCHASSAILYNHESPRRPVDFLPSKVAHAAAAISVGRQRELVLGDLDAQRDWGYAPDYVDAMWRMLQRDEPDDYVIATGELHTVRELVDVAFAHVDLDWREHVRVDEALKRGQAELHHLVGDASKARRELGWRPSVSFEQLVALLVDAARERLE